MKANQNIRLIGQKVVLVPYEPGHVLKYHSWMEDEELRQSTASELLSLEEEFEMQKKWRQDEDKCTFIILSKQYLDEKRSELESMVGDVNLFLLKSEDDENQESIASEKSIMAELEIMIAERAFRGKGLGKEAVITMILYGIDFLQLEKFQVKIGSKNATSLNLFEKLGFRRVKYVEVFDEVTLICDCSDKDLVKGMRDQCSYVVDSYQSENA